jgi:hypothetical protein
MSFSVYLNSVNGTQVAGAQSQIQYNFDFTSTPPHSGGYKVYMTFASEQQAFSPTTIQFGRVNIDLGVFDSYTSFSSYTGTANNRICGFIRGSTPQYTGLDTVPTYTMTSTAIIPVNSGTVGYTETTNTSVGSYIISRGAVQTIDAKHTDNPPTYIQSKPRNNQFIVKITYHDGTLYNILTAHYGILLTFEAI